MTWACARCSFHSVSACYGTARRLAGHVSMASQPRTTPTIRDSRRGERPTTPRDHGMRTSAPPSAGTDDVSSAALRARLVRRYPELTLRDRRRLLGDDPAEPCGGLVFGEP